MGVNLTAIGEEVSRTVTYKVNVTSISRGELIGSHSDTITGCMADMVSNEHSLYSYVISIGYVNNAGISCSRRIRSIILREDVINTRNGYVRALNSESSSALSIMFKFNAAVGYGLPYEVNVSVLIKTGHGNGIDVNCISRNRH